LAGGSGRALRQHLPNAAGGAGHGAFSDRHIEGFQQIEVEARIFMERMYAI
jgi:hypothetical protein